MLTPNISHCRSILVMRTDRIGDLLVTTPAIRALRKALPDSRIDVLASPLNMPAILGNPYIDHIYVYKRRSPLTWPALIWRLRQTKYDALLAFNSNSRNGSVFLSLLNAREKIALAGLPSHKGRTLEHYAKFYTWISPGSGRQHVLEDILGRLEALGIASAAPMESEKKTTDNPKTTRANTCMDFIVPPSMLDQAADRFPRSQGHYRLAIFVGNIKKIHNRWPIEKFRALTEKLLAAEDLNFLDVVLFAGPSDRPLLAAFNGFNHPRFQVFVGESLQESGAFLKQCDALVAGSSSPAHIAAALGVPVLSLVTEYNATFWRPLGPLDVCVTPPPELGKDLRDMRDIAVDTVEEALRRFITATARE